jgi:hypothetical protein
VNIQREGALVAFLREAGADAVAYGERTLLDHLVATGEILDRWDAGDAISRAGLFNAVYAAGHDRCASLPLEARPRVQALIGVEGERLAYAFGALDRGSLYAAIDRGEPYVIELWKGRERVVMTAAEIRSLFLILWANALAQAPHIKRSDDVRRREARTIARYAALLPERALSELYAATGAPPSVAARRGVSALFNIEDPACFLDGWPVRPFWGSGPVARLAGLVDYNFDELVTMKRSYTRAFLHGPDGGATSKILAPGEERACYDAGWVIYFHSLRSTGMDQWVAAIDDELGLLPGVTRVSAFASRRAAGLRPHYDQNDNFVCQARGVKRWRIARGRHVRFPTVGHTVGAEPTPAVRVEVPDGMPEDMPSPHDTIELRPGDVMFLPRGTFHDTETTDRESLHFNVQAGLATWGDVLQFALETAHAVRSEELRAPVLRMFDGGGPRGGIASELGDKLRAVVEALCEGELEIDRAAFLAFMAKRREAV